jgi:hypothetical protein
MSEIKIVILSITELILILFGVLVWFSDSFAKFVDISGFSRFFAGLIAIILGIGLFIIAIYFR